MPDVFLLKVASVASVSVVAGFALTIGAISAFGFVQGIGRLFS